jgi:hypothetical protein
MIWNAVCFCSAVASEPLAAHLDEAAVVVDDWLALVHDDGAARERAGGWDTPPAARPSPTTDHAAAKRSQCSRLHLIADPRARGNGYTPIAAITASAIFAPE